jgi:N-acetyl-alpha-D-muramate 1-phosphate uridylyltransferase
MMFPVAILAGGLSTRLRPLTESIPKAMVPINGIPFIDYQLHYLKHQGIEKVVLCVGYLGHIIEKHVANGSQYGINITYSYDGDTYLGTGGALIKALDLLDDNFFILYGDSFLPIEFKHIQDAFLQNQYPALMTIYKNQNQGDKSNVRLISSNLIEYNKKNPVPDMHYIDYGLSIVSKSIFKDIQTPSFLDLSDIFTDLSLHYQLSGIHVHKPFYEIGTPKGLLRTQNFLCNFNLTDHVR